MSDYRWHPLATVVVVALSAAAWLAMFGGLVGHNAPFAKATLSPTALALAQISAAICGRPPVAGASLLAHGQWLAGWAIMIVAMMLPTTLPFLREVHEVAGRHHTRLVVTAGLAFVATWTAVGLALIAGAAALSRVPLNAALVQPGMLAGLAALVTGAYQFTPLKKACLDACRSPRAMLLCYWNGRRPLASAVEVGLRYGAVCIGCCWATMLLTLLVGTYALPLMVAAAAIMLAERMLPWVRPLIPVQAGLAVGLGLILMLGGIPAELPLALP